MEETYPMFINFISRNTLSMIPHLFDSLHLRELRERDAGIGTCPLGKGAVPAGRLHSRTGVDASAQ